MTGPDNAENAVDPLDIHLGRRIRGRRTTIMLPLEALAQSLGVSPETLATIEAGRTRLNPTQLHRLSEVLQVPVSYFFEAMPRELAPDFPGTPAMDSMAQTDETTRDALDLLRAFAAIGGAPERRRVVDLARSLADIPENE